MTTLYIGQVPAEFASDSEYFEFEGTKYYFKLEYYSMDQFRFARLYDTAGRMIPVDADHFAHMAEAFEIINNLEDQLKAQEDFQADVANMCVEVI